MILIGDHQQLRPNPTVFELAKHYSLDVSLFERMVKNGMPFERLRLQHRMRPEISKMLDHIYFNPKLENHESVLNFANIKGVNRNMYFVDHEENEVGLTFTKWNTPLMCSCQYCQYNANYVQRQRLEGTRKAPKRMVRSWGGGGGAFCKPQFREFRIYLYKCLTKQNCAVISICNAQLSYCIQE